MLVKAVRRASPRWVPDDPSRIDSRGRHNFGCCTDRDRPQAFELCRTGMPLFFLTSGASG